MKDFSEDRRKAEISPVSYEQMAHIWGIEEVYQLISQELLGSGGRFQREIFRYLLRSPGKGLRPLLVLMCSGFSTSRADVKPLAAGMEMLHLATLVHDDIVDRADKRRGKDSINALWGDGAAVITGDMLFGKSLKLVERYGNKAVKVYAEIIERMVSGEFQQMEAVFDYSLTEASYLSIAGKKTAYFFSQCCRLGAWAAGVCQDQVKILERFGFLLGLAFQIQDDIMDWFSSEGELGKPVGQDLRRGIITLPLIKALKLSEKREEIKKIIDKENFQRRKLIS